ncbi:hypothetical protein HYW44_01240 [Candidatus Daviesbacteria bacterium]|nr:hypothetical protein [Candidatus Daviesbacteria bacterium]
MDTKLNESLKFGMFYKKTSDPDPFKGFFLFYRLLGEENGAFKVSIIMSVNLFI